MNHFMLECSEGSKTAGQVVSHFYKVENSICTCVFCGDKKEKDFFNMTMNQYNDYNPFTSVIGQRS